VRVTEDPTAKFSWEFGPPDAHEIGTYAAHCRVCDPASRRRLWTDSLPSSGAPPPV